MLYRNFCFSFVSGTLITLITVLLSGPVVAQENDPKVELAPLPTPVEGHPAVPDNSPLSQPLVESDPSGRGGFGPGAGMFNPIVGHAPTVVDFRTTWLPNEAVPGQGTTLGFVREDVSVSVPVWQDCANEWAVNAGLRSEQIHTSAILPTTDQPFPDDLWSIRFGTSFRHLFDNGWIAGGALSFGSASDQPFHSVNELTGGVNLFLRVPQGEANAWLFTLSYSPTNELAFPVPGVAYIWQPTEALRVNVGLPFQVMWRPTEELTFDVSYMLVRTFHARIAYRLYKPVTAYVGYDWENESWFLVDSPDVHDRFFYYDQRVSVGVRGRLGNLAVFDLSSGFVFNQFYFEGKNASSESFNRVDVNDAPVLSLRLAFHY